MWNNLSSSSATTGRLVVGLKITRRSILKGEDSEIWSVHVGFCLAAEAGYHKFKFGKFWATN